MSALGTTNLTLADWAKRLDPKGEIHLSDFVEMLNQTNEVLSDAVFVQGNLPTGHRSVIRTGLPTVYWRSLNAGVPRSKSTTATVDESCGMLEAYSAIDVDLAMLNGNTAEFRLSEDRPFIESMNQTMASTIFYGNVATQAASFTGLATRFSSLSAGNGGNIVVGGASSGSCTSIWLVVWGDNTVFCTFPKGSQAGLMQKDDGDLTVYDASGYPYHAFQSHYQWKNGLVVKDWRYVVRIPNLLVTDLRGVSGTMNANQLVELMVKALGYIPNISMGKAAFYMNQAVHTTLMIQALNKSNTALAIESGLTQFGKPSKWLSFLGVPLRRVDSILNTESVVT